MYDIQSQVVANMKNKQYKDKRLHKGHVSDKATEEDIYGNIIVEQSMYAV